MGAPACAALLELTIMPLKRRDRFGHHFVLPKVYGPLSVFEAGEIAEVSTAMAPLSTCVRTLQRIETACAKNQAA